MPAVDQQTIGDCGRKRHRLSQLTHFPLRVQGAYERVVCQILGISASPQATLQPAVQPALMADVELFEGGDHRHACQYHWMAMIILTILVSWYYARTVLAKYIFGI
ncbi:hypothetical protein RU08_05890 [Pseudomonas fulva]|uniref:Uncharacterized protein n=1 Tax=Pseudomonas fulva TaxID=47880 RepID=A0A0D0L457_9PSED|nr:hypothetical protein RU08_05890 [Pseudomonas fulva]